MRRNNLEVDSRRLISLGLLTRLPECLLTKETMKFCSVFWFLFAFLSLARVPAMDGLPDYGLLLEMEKAFAGHRRNLQEDRACNEIIEVFPKEAVRILGERLTAAFLADNPALVSFGVVCMFCDCLPFCFTQQLSCR